MERLERFAEQATPVFTNLNSGRAGHQHGLHATCPEFSRARKVLREPRRDVEAIGPGAASSTKPLLERLQALGTGGQAVLHQPRRTVHEPARNRRARADHGLHLPRRRRGQRLRLARALPAHRGRGNSLRQIRLILDALSCNAQTRASSRHHRDESQHQPIGRGFVMERTLAVINGATPGPGDRQVPRADPTPAEATAHRARHRLGIAASTDTAGRRLDRRARPTTRPPPKARKPTACSSTTCWGTERCDDRPTPPTPPADRASRSLAAGICRCRASAAETATGRPSPTVSGPRHRSAGSDDATVRNDDRPQRSRRHLTEAGPDSQQHSSSQGTSPGVGSHRAVEAAARRVDTRRSNRKRMRPNRASRSRAKHARGSRRRR